MSPSRSTYDPLPRNSTSLDLDSSSAEQFKDKPLPSHRHLIQRKLRRCASRTCRPWPISLLLVCFLIWQLTFNASYSLSSAPPFTPSSTETVFIAANIIDGELITGAWGKSLLELVESIGSERVFVSIYGGPTDALKSLEGMLECESSVVSEEEQPLDMSTIPRTLLPTGEWKVKRIAYLAEVRNKVLEPLYKPDSKGGKPRKWDKILFINDVYFEAEGARRLLWGTNVNEQGESVYKAVCAADFVTSWKYYDTFATRDIEGYSIGVPLFPWFSAEGEAVTRNDVLAGKDAVRVRSCWGGMVAFRGEYFWDRNGDAKEGDENSQGKAVSADIHPAAQNDPSSSSQSGDQIAKMKANNGLGVPQLPLRFRSEPEPFWDSSECCLIHADIIALTPKGPETRIHRNAEGWNTGIYMNPYVRTAYSKGAFGGIGFAKRWERLMSPLQRVLNYVAHMPRWNYRRSETEGQVVHDRLWISIHSNMTEQESVWKAEHEFDTQAGKSFPERGLGRRELEERDLKDRATLGKVRGKEYWGSEGYYVDYKRTAKRGGYCGVRQLLVMKEIKALEEGGEGGNWDNLLDRVPPVDV